MKVRELNVSISQKVNTGNYSSKGYGLSATAELSDFDDVLYVVRFNRDYTPDIIEDILMHRRCPVDLHLYIEDFGTEDIE